jgi:hypothetical protein
VTMITTEPTLIKRLANLLFIGIVLAAIGVFIFRSELTEGVSDAMNDNNAMAIKRRWQPNVEGKFTLRTERDDAAFLQVTNLRSGAPTTIGVPISFDLTNLGDANGFPSLAVFMVDAAGQKTRQVDFQPNDYPHSSRFEKERIELVLRPAQHETSFTVHAYYGGQR